jgi:DNA polymerase phi
LYELEEVDITNVLELLEKHTTPSGNISGVVCTLKADLIVQEERGFYFGRLFGLNVILKSKILVRPTTSRKAISTTINHLISLALKKPWLREPSSKALCDLITTIPHMRDGKAVAGEVFRSIEDAGLLRTQDGVGILFSLNTLPTDVKPKVSTKIWQYGNPLHPSNLALLSKVLRDIPSEDDVFKPSGNFNTEEHFVWTFILQRYREHAKDIVGFKSLWDSVVESSLSDVFNLTADGFFASSSSLERKFRGFQLFSIFLLQLPEDFISSLFSPNFMRCLVNHSSSGDRYLNKAAKRSVCL